MALKDDYLKYADSIGNFLENPNSKSYRQVRLIAKKIEERFYGVSITSPKLLSGLESTLKLLLSGDSLTWYELTEPLTRTLPCCQPFDWASSEPVYHRLDSIKNKRASLKKAA